MKKIKLRINIGNIFINITKNTYFSKYLIIFNPVINYVTATIQLIAYLPS